jgi:hypothetical protein
MWIQLELKCPIILDTEWEGLGILLGQAVSKMQFCIVKLTNGPIKLLLVTEPHSSEAPT